MSSLDEELVKPIKEIFYFIVGIVGATLGLLIYGIFRTFEYINERKDGKK